MVYNYHVAYMGIQRFVEVEKLLMDYRSSGAIDPATNLLKMLN